jgi:hypothetical protein
VRLTSAPGFDPARDQLWVQWYQKVPTGPSASWAALPDISGPRSDRDLQHDGYYYDEQSFVGITADSGKAACLPRGTYRVELYLNGHLVPTSPVAEVRGPELVAARDRGTRIALCIPADWRPVGTVKYRGSSLDLQRVPGLVSGWRSSDRSQGAYLFRLDNQFKPPAPNGRESKEESAQVADTAVRRFFDFLFPGRPSPYGAVNRSRPFVIAGNAIGRDFEYRLAGRNRAGDFGYIKAGAAFDSDDVAIVGAVYGPYSDRAEREAVFDSISLTF